MFRKKSLDKMTNPDSLDQLLVVVTPKAVFMLISLSLVLAIAIVWSVMARVPVTVDGLGILLKPNSLKAVQSPSAGIVTDTLARIGDKIDAGDTLARVDQAELERQLEQEIARFKAARDFNTQALQISGGRRRGDAQAQAVTESSARKLQSSTTARLADLSGTQNANLEKTREVLTALRDSQLQQLQNITSLVSKGIAAETQRLSAQSVLNDTESRLADIEVRIKQNVITLIDAEQGALRRTQELEQQDSQLAASIRLLKERIYRQGSARTQFSGKILEVGVSVGQISTNGQRMFNLAAEPQEPFVRLDIGAEASRGGFTFVAASSVSPVLPPSVTAERLRQVIQSMPAFARFSVQVQQKAARPQFEIRFAAAGEGSPRTPPRLEVRDAGLVDADGIPSFATIFEFGSVVLPEELRHLAFLQIGPGKRVQTGMEVRINPSNVERQRFGSMMGVVRKVSEFPVTVEGVVNLIGNTEVAKTLLEKGGTMLIEVELTPDPSTPTGFKWTSKGPDEPITAGTTTTSRITVETRAPISFALPLLRTWVLGDADRLPKR